jgi:hypothetical protein
LILYKLSNIKGFFAAQGGALCQKKAADSGQFIQNPLGRPDFGFFCQKFRLKAASLRRRISNKIAQNPTRQTRSEFPVRHLKAR